MKEYNRTSYQTYDQSFCGQMCLRFLQTVDAREFKKLDEMLWNLNTGWTFPIMSLTREEHHPNYIFDIDLSDGDYELWRFLRLITRYRTWTNRNNKFRQRWRGNYNSRGFVRSGRHKWIFEMCDFTKTSALQRAWNHWRSAWWQ